MNNELRFWKWGNRLCWFMLGVQILETIGCFMGGVYGAAWLGVATTFLWIYNIRTSQKEIEDRS